MLFCQRCGQPRAVNFHDLRTVGPCRQCGSWSFGQVEPEVRVLPTWSATLTAWDRAFLRALHMTDD